MDYNGVWLKIDFVILPHENKKWHVILFDSIFIINASYMYSTLHVHVELL
jgi:hypothetical protein